MIIPKREQNQVFYFISNYWMTGYVCERTSTVTFICKLCKANNQCIYFFQLYF